MPNRSINVSVRMSEREAAILAAADIPGADTASEKLRALIAELGRRQEAEAGYPAMAERVTEMLAPARRAIRARAGPRSSDVLTALFERLPESVARLAAAPERLEGGETPEAIEKDGASDAAALAAELLHVAEMAEPRALDAKGLGAALESLTHHGAVLRRTTED